MATYIMKKIWTYINDILLQFRDCFSREATFLWFLIVVAGLMTRSDHLGVSSIIRELLIDPNKYPSLIHFFHSTAWTLKKLQIKWVEIIKNSGYIFRIQGLIVLIGDGVKQAKESSRMPGVKKLHQESEDSSKSEYIRGHFFGGIGILVGGLAKLFCLPLSMTLHDGNKTILGWEDSEYNEDSHVKRLVSEACRIAQSLGEVSLLLLDRFFLTKPALEAIKEAAAKNGGIWPVILITRPKDNYTAWYKPNTQTDAVPEGNADVNNENKETKKTKRGRKPKADKDGKPKAEKPPLGEKVKIMDIFRLKTEHFKKAIFTLYGEQEEVSYFCVNLLWGRDLYQELRFVFVINFDNVKSVFVSTALDMDPQKIVEAYCFRFKIETLFRTFKQSIAGFGYRFWTRRLPALDIFIKAEAMEQKIKEVTAQISKDSIISTYHAIEGFVMFACIATGLIQLCSLRFANEINNNENRWTRTSNKGVPAEETTIVNLRFALPTLFRKCHELALAQAIRAKQSIEVIEQNFEPVLSKPA